MNTLFIFVPPGFEQQLRMGVFEMSVNPLSTWLMKQHTSETVCTGHVRYDTRVSHTMKQRAKFKLMRLGVGFFCSSDFKLGGYLFLLPILLVKTAEGQFGFKNRSTPQVLSAVGKCRLCVLAVKRIRLWKLTVTYHPLAGP